MDTTTFMDCTLDWTRPGVTRPGGRPLRNLCCTAASLLLTVLLFSGCAGRVPSPELLTEEARPITQTFDQPAEAVLAAAETAAREWGFQLGIFNQETRSMVGAYVLEDEEQTTTLLLCVRAHADVRGTTLFATAIETVEQFNAGNNDWFLVVPEPTAPPLGETQVTSETVLDAAFYRRFFTLVEKKLPNVYRATHAAQVK